MHAPAASAGAEQTEGVTTGEAGWRVEEIAERSGLAVDTIRFYQREGLLSAPRRSGRTALYDQVHLDRLAKIRSLQAGHLSLAAIKSLLDSSRGALADAIFGPAELDLTLDQAAADAGVSLDLAEELVVAGLLKEPASLGRRAYDGADLRLMEAVRSFLDAGIPRPVVVRLAEIYATGFASMEHQVMALFTEAGELTETELCDMQDRLTSGVEPVLRAMESVLAYCHQRTVQGLTYRAVTEEVNLAAPA